MRKFLTKTLKVGQWVCGVAATLWGASTKADVTRVTAEWAFAGGCLQFLQDWAWFASPALVCAIGLLQWIRRYVEPKPWDAVHAVLDRFREFAFRALARDPPHYHSATLFKACSAPRAWYKPFVRDRILAVVQRSGHTRLKTDTTFLIPDQADRAEGIAGRTWAMDKIVSVANLPDLVANGAPENIQQYADATSVSIVWIKNRIDTGKNLPRSLWGIPIEVRNKKWGVLVLDSRSPKKILNRNMPSSSLGANILEQLLAEMNL